MRRIAALALLLLALAPAVAAAQSSPFGPLPAPPPDPTPVPTVTPTGQDDVSRELMFGIAGGVALIFLVIGWFITRDARHNLTRHDREALERTQRTEEEKRRGKVVKSQARKKGKAQRQARKAQRRR
jgi:hypothetical protein